MRILKKNVLIAAITSCMVIVSSGALAWKPEPPFCQYNCVPPHAEIYANPPTVIAPPDFTPASTEIIWKWDQARAMPYGPVLELACIYVQVNSSIMAHVVQCEYPGNFYYTTIPWIQAGSYYDFTVSIYVGDSPMASSLFPLAFRTDLPGAINTVRVTGIPGTPPGGGGGGGGGGGIIVN